MTQQVIDIGSAPDDSTGDPLRTSFDKTNDNFTELYAKGLTEGLWNYNQTSSDTSTTPVLGRFKTNSGNYRDATQIAIHATTIQGIDRSSTLRTLLVGDLIQCQDKSNAAAWCRYSLQSLPVDHGTWFQLNVTFQADGGVASGDNQEIVFVFTASSGSTGGGAPLGAEYITSTADATLTAERVLTDTATVTWDRATAGQIKANAAGGGGTSITISDTPPASPTTGSLWWESDTGTLWIYYNDGTSSQWVTAAGGGAASNTITTVAVQKFTASGTYTPTVGMKYCIIEAVGGGGGGGGSTSASGQAFAGGGGGSGGYSRALKTAAQVGSSQAVTVGALGSGASGAVDGSAGGDTSVGTLCIGKGGNGGVVGNGSSIGGGGNGGIAGTGDVTAVGAPGIGGLYSANTSNVQGSFAAGGSSIFGGGAAAVIVTSTVNNGIAAGAYGSGGSGGVSNSTATASNGGNGSAGIVIITEYV